MPTPALHIHSLKFRYPDASRNGEIHWTVDAPSLVLNRGDQALLAGGSGSGKSTLLQLLAGLLDPAEGKVEIDGTPIHSLRGAARDRHRGSKVGFIFQTFNLLPGFTALENVMAALMFSDIKPAEHRDRAADLLKKLGIDRPTALVDRLSIGQQQRVAVARAVACDPVLVLADEPTASLDPENANAAMDLIQQTCKDRNAALLCVSHDPAMRSRFPTIATIDNGFLKPAP